MGEVNKKEVGQRIRGIRASLGETAEKFGERFDPVANRGLVSAWENGRYLPNNERLVNIAELAGISVDELLYGEPKTYLNNLLWNSKSLDDFSDITFDKFFDNLKESVINNDDLYLSENEAVERYKRFAEINKLDEHVDPLGYLIYSALENKKNPHAVQIFLTEADNNFSLLFGKSLKDAYDDYTKELNNKK